MKCKFCKEEIPKGKGILLASSKGDVAYYCSSKCEKNATKLKRKPEKVNWVRKNKK